MHGNIYRTLILLLFGVINSNLKNAVIFNYTTPGLSYAFDVQIDVKPYYNDWKLISINNIAVQISHFYVNDYYNHTAPSMPTYSYNASNGILTASLPYHTDMQGVYSFFHGVITFKIAIVK